MKIVSPEGSFRWTFLFTFLINTSVGKKSSYIYLERFDNCPGFNNLTSVVRNVQIQIVNGIMYMNYETHVLKDSRGLLEFVWEIDRCSSKENLNTCFTFSRVRSNKFCAFIASQEDAWSPFVGCMQPPMTCPLKKGVYAGKNCTIDGTAFKLFPLQGAYWKFRAKVMERKAIMRMCVDVFGYMRDN